MSHCIINKLQCSLHGMANWFIVNLGCSCFVLCCLFEVVFLSFFLPFFHCLAIYPYIYFLARGHYLIGWFVTRSIVIITFDLYQSYYGQNSKIGNTLKSHLCLWTAITRRKKTFRCRRFSRSPFLESDVI